MDTNVYIQYVQVPCTHITPYYSQVQPTSWELPYCISLQQSHSLTPTHLHLPRARCGCLLLPSTTPSSAHRPGPHPCQTAWFSVAMQCWVGLVSTYVCTALQVHYIRQVRTLLLVQTSGIMQVLLEHWCSSPLSGQPVSNFIHNFQDPIPYLFLFLGSSIDRPRALSHLRAQLWTYCSPPPPAHTSVCSHRVHPSTFLVLFFFKFGFFFFTSFLFRGFILHFLTLPTLSSFGRQPSAVNRQPASQPAKQPTSSSSVGQSVSQPTRQRNKNRLPRQALCRRPSVRIVIVTKS